MIFAYIDPGAGSMLIQAILAGVLAIPFILRTRLLDFARRVRESFRPADDPQAD
jgi:hypothetical protein